MVKKIISALTAVFLVLSMHGCGEMKKTRYEAEFLTLFDTLTQIVAYTDTKEEFVAYSQIIHDSLKEYHEYYDIYHEYDGKNNLKTINDNAGIKPIEVDERILALIKFAKREHERSQGRVNIALGAVLRIWHEYRRDGVEDAEQARLPSMEELQAAAMHTNIDDIVIDEEKSTVFLKDAKMSLDVGAVAKGFAVERAAEIAAKSGFISGLINVGGNIKAVGAKDESGTPWNVGIQNPENGRGGASVATVYLTDACLVTSGDYLRYYTVNGLKYHHIIDSQTLFPAEYFRAVTIIDKNSAVADALSTAVFNMPFEEGFALIDSMEGTEALWIGKDGEIRFSADFKDYTKQ